MTVAGVPSRGRAIRRAHRARTRWIVAAVLVLAALAGGGWVLSAPRPAFDRTGNAIPDQGGDPDKGRLVFAAGDCASCHASPGQTDRFRLGGGMALASLYGTFRVPNISPDPVDGIGRWRTVDLANALLSGVSPAGTHYYPVFPYSSFVHMTVADVGDLMAFLRTLPPVAGRPPPHELTFPFTIRRFLGFWKLLFLDRRALPMDPGRGAAWNRGRYLVEAVAHCAECHSTRDVFGAVKPATRFAGGPNPEGTGFAPNITPAGIGTWSVQDIVAALTTGRTPDGRVMGASMADVVTNMAMLPQSDREAIAVYIKSLPPRPTPIP